MYLRVAVFQLTVCSSNCLFFSITGRHHCPILVYKRFTPRAPPFLPLLDAFGTPGYFTPSVITGTWEMPRPKIWRQ